MNIVQCVRVALQSLAASRLRSGLTMLGIVIGVGAVIALLAAGAGAEAQVRERFESLGSNLLVVTPRAASFRGVSQGAATARGLTNDDVEAIAHLARSVFAIAPQYSLQASVAYGNRNTRTAVLGVTPEYLTVGNWEVAQGRFIDEVDLMSRARVAVLGDSVVEELFGGTFIDPEGRTIRIDRQYYRIVGVMASKGVGGFQNLDDQVFIPLDTAQVKFGGAGNRSLQAINVQVVSADKIERAKGELASILRACHGLSASQTDDFRVRDH